jgi:hypothetical protein
MEVAESVAGLLIYKELDYSCIHRGKNFSSISSGQRPNTPAGIVLGHTLILYKRFILCSNTERTAIVVHFENN